MNKQIFFELLVSALIVLAIAAWFQPAAQAEEEPVMRGLFPQMAVRQGQTLNGVTSPLEFTKCIVDGNKIWLDLVSGERVLAKMNNKTYILFGAMGVLDNKCAEE